MIGKYIQGAGFAANSGKNLPASRSRVRNVRLDIFWILPGLVLFLASLTVAADSSYLNTRFSELRIVGDLGREVLVSNDRVVPGIQCKHDEYCGRLSIEKSIAWRPDADVLVLSRNSGGVGCPGESFQFVLLPQDGPERASKPWNTCSYLIAGTRVSDEAVELDIHPFKRPDLSHIVLRFDGSTLEQTEVLRDDSDARVAGPGSDVTRWDGAGMYRILDNSTERQRFATIMSFADLNTLALATHQLDPFYADFKGLARVVDGFLVAVSCGYPCGVSAGYGGIAVEIETGQPYAFQYWENGCKEGLSVYGAMLEDLPEPLQEIIQSLFSFDECQ